MARLKLINMSKDKNGNYSSFTYAIEKHPKTKLVVQRNPQGYWFIYKLTGKNARMLSEQGFKVRSEATKECVRLAELMF
jgi:hypothetical protein